MYDGCAVLVRLMVRLMVRRRLMLRSGSMWPLLLLLRLRIGWSTIRPDRRDSRLLLLLLLLAGATNQLDDKTENIVE